jgi:hypothetical protein
MTGTVMWRERIKEHPAAAMFPLLADTAPDELWELAADIKKNGLQQQIVLWSPTQFPGRDPKEKYLLDGRNRLDALELAFADDPERLAERLDDALYPDPENGARLLGGEVDPWDFVISANAHRRHLTPEKKRQLVADLLKARPERSDRATAKIARSNRTTVGQIRRDLERSGDVSIIDTRTDTAGRQQPSRKLGAHARTVTHEKLAAIRAEAPTESDASPAVEAIGDRKDALRVLEDTTRFLAQRRPEVLAIPVVTRIARIRGLMDALGLDIGDLVPAGRR